MLINIYAKYTIMQGLDILATNYILKKKKIKHYGDISEETKPQTSLHINLFSE